MCKKFSRGAGRLSVGAADASVPLSRAALPLPFLSATDARSHRCGPITAQHPAGSDVVPLRATPTPLK